jgi:broad specificity phosphatase PhoE
MSEYYLLRHGLTFSNKHNFPYGVHLLFSRHISKDAGPAIESQRDFLKGEFQVQHVDFEDIAAFRSPVRRCGETVDILTEGFPLHFKVEPDLCDIKVWELVMFNAFKDRIRSFADKLRRLNNEYAIVCSHQSINTALAFELTERRKYGLRDLNKYSQPETMAIVNTTNNAIKVKDFSSARRV